MLLLWIVLSILVLAAICQHLNLRDLAEELARQKKMLQAFAPDDERWWLDGPH